MIAWQNSQKNDGKYKSMALVDIDVAFDIMGSYMMRITYMLREIELMTLVGVIYIDYIVDMNFTCMLFFIKIG